VTHALTTIDRDPRLPSPMDKGRLKSFLAVLEDPETLELNNRLAAAYDKACASLIGAGDVQREGTRTFKKKSAWRKLARYFTISTEITKETKEYVNDVATGESYFVATCEVRATSPWGQLADAIGACGTDEEEGNRTITMADAISTAQTRATNRAISDLIAMGEVSAEELSRGEKVKAQSAIAADLTLEDARATVFPWPKPEKYRGKTLAEVSVGTLRVIFDAMQTEIQKSGESPRRVAMRRACELLIHEHESRWTPSMAAIVDAARKAWAADEFTDKDRQALMKRLDEATDLDAMQSVLNDIYEVVGAPEDAPSQTPSGGGQTAATPSDEPTVGPAPDATTTDAAPPSTSPTSTTDGVATEKPELPF
jgi:hypothetical protein